MSPLRRLRRLELVPDRAAVGGRLDRKIKEACLAIKLSDKWSKPLILDEYLNAQLTLSAALLAWPVTLAGSEEDRTAQWLTVALSVYLLPQAIPL